MSQSHTIKGGTSDEAFVEQCFLWKTVRTFNFLAFKIFHVRKKICNTQKECGKKPPHKKHNESSFNK